MKKVLLSFIFVLFTFTLVSCTLDNKTDYTEKIIFNGLRESDYSSEDVSTDSKNIQEKVTLVHLEMNYDLFEPLDKSSVTDSNVDDLVRLNRDSGKKYHQPKNVEIAQKLDLYNEIRFYASTYTPFITFELDTTDKTEIFSHLEAYASSKDVKLVNVDVIDKFKINKEMDTMFNDIGSGTYSSYADYNGYDGTGVVIGILEYGGDCIFGSGGIVDEDHANFTGVDLEIRNEWYCNEKENDHATLVASIAGGNTGIARNAKLLSVQTDAIGYASEFDWMLDRDVNVVNMSLNDAGLDGYYSGTAAYLDFVVRNYWVSIVKSAGNTGGNISSPGTGYNIITVGSLSNSSTLSSYSAWEEHFKISKPNLVAPGSSIRAGTAGPNSGTSFAAPHVTGAIALMMDRSSTLKVHPESVMAILQATADNSNLDSTYNDYDISGLEEKVGAGMLRVDRAVDGVYRRASIYISNNDMYKMNIREIKIHLSSGDDFQASLVWLKNMGYSGSTLYPYSSTDLDLKLYNPSGNLVASSISSGDNQEYIRFTASNSGYYTLKVYQFGNYATVGKEYITVAYWSN